MQSVANDFGTFCNDSFRAADSFVRVLLARISRTPGMAVTSRIDHLSFGEGWKLLRLKSSKVRTDTFALMQTGTAPRNKYLATDRLMIKRAPNWSALVLIIVFSSCRPSPTTKDYSKFEKRVFAAYCTNDIRAAERALIDGLQTVDQFERRHVEGIDFDAAKALLHERLFLIYLKTHKTNKMTLEFQQSMECLARSDRRWGLPPPPNMSYQTLAQKLNWRERNANVRWKTNAYEH